ncbi:MAG: AI-2E family transporter [Acidobacteria bacterium]|nr:AI-2E family transporter [Acidobacteriota bacterium]
MSRIARDRFTQLLFYAVLLLVGYLAFLVVRPFLAPLAWAAILATLLSAVQRRLEASAGPNLAALVTTLLAALLIIGPAVLLASLVLDQLPQALAYLKGLSAATPERLEEIWLLVRSRSPVVLPEEPTEAISQAFERAASFLAPRAGAVLADAVATIGSLFVMLFALFFMLRDARTVGATVRRVLPFSEAERERLMTKTRDLVIASVGAGLTVAFVQGLIGGVTFWLLGLSAPAVWGVAMGFCSLIPVVGATLVWVPTAIWLLLSGEIGRGLVLAGIGAGVIGTADNVLRPILLSGRTSVNGLVVFIGLLGGVSAFGFVGLVLGPIVLVIAGTLVEALTSRVETPELELLE